MPILRVPLMSFSLPTKAQICHRSGCSSDITPTAIENYRILLETRSRNFSLKSTIKLNNSMHPTTFSTTCNLLPCCALSQSFESGYQEAGPHAIPMILQ
jgi:hypothetical protein